MNSTTKNSEHNSFHSDKNLSREEIATYLSTADPRLKNTIEKKALQSSFESEALEGWSESEANLTVLKSIDKKFESKTNYLIPSIIVVGVVIIILGIVFLQKDNITTPTDLASKSNASTQTTLEKTDVVLPEKIDTLVKIAKSKAIKPAFMQATFETKTATPENIKSTQTHNESELQVFDLPVLDVAPPKNNYVKSTMSAKEIYLSDLKLVDYREYRSKPAIKSETLKLTGTPANLDSITAISEEQELWQDVSIPYIDYLRKTQSLFAKENYKKALSRYLTILETYPDDVNALFYSALCYYNLQQYEVTADQLHKCLGSKYDNFSEEAEWFLAQSYQASGDKEKAKSVYKLIIEKNGFYAKQAKIALTK